MEPIRIALIGLGKIARDQHIPAISSNDRFALVATADPSGSGVSGVPHAETLGALLEAGHEIDAVVLCTPPQVRRQLAELALTSGLHVFLEKPPGATVSELELLHGLARKQRKTLFASWHSRFGPAVEPARSWLAGRRVERVSVTWRENVRVWHPGQSWIWEPGGFGVFDPAINALSILTHILPHPFFATRARLDFPANCGAPIAADVEFRDCAGMTIAMDLNFLQTGPQIWEIIAETDTGTLALSAGGRVLSLPSGATTFEKQEYPALYRHFENLVQTCACDVDARPLQLVADIFLCGVRKTVEPYYD